MTVRVSGTCGSFKGQTPFYLRKLRTDTKVWWEIMIQVWYTIPLALLKHHKGPVQEEWVCLKSLESLCRPACVVGPNQTW